MFRLAVITVAAFVVLVAMREAACADEAPLRDDQVAFFEQKVRPLLIERCYQCHSQEKKVQGGLRLDSRAGWKTGGDTGPAIVPGQTDTSLLIKAIRYGDSELQMPPSGKLTDAELAIFEEWVRIGAPDPREEKTDHTKTRDYRAEAAGHWAYQPLRTVAVPTVQRAEWPLNDIDNFVLWQLEQKGFTPSPDANRYHWLRRVSLDLTGIPPTPNEIRNFIDDVSDLAFERVVDRLLASPAYGERWARAWLDLVGYADQIGSANNVPADHAWRYRDYVIRAFNSDRPFDEFLREQLAGDLLDATSIEQRQDQLTATGFLVLGNVNVVEADKLIMQMDLVDQQIEKVGKVFLGMTLNCVRCHDHKFDPITIQDYYGLAGIFASTESTYKIDRGLWSSVTKVDLPETLDQFSKRQGLLAQHDRKVAKVHKERAATEARLKELDTLIKTTKEATESAEASAKQLADLEKEKTELSAKFPGFDQRLWHLDYLRPVAPVAFGVKDVAQPNDAKVQVRGNPHVLGREVSRGFVEVASHGESPAIGKQQSGRQQLAEWLTHSASPLVSRVMVNRLWEKLFGKGIARSVDYLGLRSEPPTDPELLEYLASQLIREGWSQKRMLRQMALSRTYRQQAETNERSKHAFAEDPDNKYLWRMSPRRLDAEMLRDSILAVTNGLEVCSGGPALIPEFVENVGGLNPKDVNPISFGLSKFRENQYRIRTVYLPVVRSSGQAGPADILNFFDFPQPSRMTGDRPTTSVASQALFLLNGPLLKDASRRLANDLLAQPGLKNDSDRIATLYLSVLNRPATIMDLAAAEAFLSATDLEVSGDAAAAADSVAKWQRLIHALLASNAFLFRL